MTQFMKHDSLLRSVHTAACQRVNKIIYEMSQYNYLPAAENFPSTGLAAHTLQGLSGRTFLFQGASLVVCIQTLPCTASS